MWEHSVLRVRSQSKFYRLPMYSQISERIWYDGGSQSGSFTIVLVCVVMYSWWNAKLLPREFSLIFVLLVHVTKWSNQIALLLS